MKKTLTALALAIGTIGSAQAAAVQWSVNGHWYEYIATPMDWHGARADALSRGGYLATLTSAAENMFASSVAAGGALAWIGLTDEAVDGVWRWADGPEGGSITGYTSWNGGEPNNCCGGEDYVHTNWGGVGLWNDHGGPGNPGQLNGYIVEYVPEPTSLALVMGALLAGAVARRRQS